MVYLTCAVSQILWNCFFGSRVSSESDGLIRAIFASQWMDRNQKCKRALQILGERTRRPMTIYAGGIIELSLQTFVKVRPNDSYIRFEILEFLCP